MRDFVPSLVTGLLLLAPGFTARGNETRFSHADQPAGDRWMYPFNFTPGTRTTASTFSNLPDDPGADDDRMGQFIIKFDTVAAGIPAGLGPDNYHLDKVVLTTVIALNADIQYDPTEDSRLTYGPDSEEDMDAGRPMELFGVGFRGGFTEFSFEETSPYGSFEPGSRNAYAMGFSPAGVARDVSSSVTSGFDSLPWAIGRVEVGSVQNGYVELQPGDTIPKYAHVVFELNLAVPGVANYVRQGFHNGFLWLSLSSFHSVAQEATSGFPSFFTKDHPEQAQFHDVAPVLDAEFSLPLRITAFTHDGATHASHVEWNGSPGFQYVVQASPNMEQGSWLNLTPVPVTTASPAQLFFNPPVADGDRRFFRVVRLAQP